MKKGNENKNRADPAWKEVSGTRTEIAVLKEPGQYVEGMLAHRFETQYGEAFKIASSFPGGVPGGEKGFLILWGKFDLVDKLRDVPLGEMIRVEYLGLKGKMKVFKVQRRTPTDSETTEWSGMIAEKKGDF